MTATSTGRAAEDAAAEFLKTKGYKIIDQNWRTKMCEIDIVAKKKKVLYFVEVKYRKSDSFGGGLEYITPKKLDQMKFAAKYYVSENKWSGDYRLSAVEVSGRDFRVVDHIENLID